MTRMRGSGQVLRYLLWAVFVNLVDVWFIRPLALDGSVYGVLAIALLACLWWTSIVPEARRRFVTFTLFALLMGEGMDRLAARPLAAALALGLVMVLGLCVLARIVGRVRPAALLLCTIALAGMNAWLPLDQWAFLTHFRVVYHTRVGFDPADLPALPLEVVQTDHGQAVVTLANVTETQQEIQREALEATGSPGALGEMLRDFGHRYAYVQLAPSGGGLALTPASPDTLARLDLTPFIAPFFPFVRADWILDGDRVLQYMGPAADARDLTRMALSPADAGAAVTGLGNTVQAEEARQWQQVLGALGVQEKPRLVVEDGVLRGQWQGKSIHIPVDGSTIVGQGAFTAPGAHEVLVQGVNRLQIVSLDRGEVVSTYRGPADNPLPNDVVVGPVDNTGRDVIFVNGQPASILSAEHGMWRTLYTAPNDSLRFEGSVRFPGDGLPEILTDDPSWLRDSPVRYFTSYTWRDGQLVRNWRVFQTNVVHVQTVRFSPQDPPELVLTLYGSGHIFVLRRHFVPVIPAAAVVLAAVIVAGWGMRWRRRGGMVHAKER
ncbi:hypothetical protein [Alicyclobacillus sp.]|uniref:hypothetical protein n=1 Tax=Alicyclobacillus sp. TaxID=61169 RepID=UPI0025BEF0B7|nr:hypothetical protein [Alicyclobacillus sp.]MCL6515663.1 hypothetical protein [Alicyclobacillus sp.]